MEDGETCEFRCCCDQQVRYRGRSVYPAFGESELQIDRAVFDLRGQVLNGHRGDGRFGEQRAMVGVRSCGVANLEPGDGRDAHEPAIDPAGPPGCIG